MAEEKDKVKISRGSWLRNVDYHKLEKTENVTWTRFNPPKLDKERPGDIEFELNRELRPEQVANKFYENQQLWWVIAYANNLKHPLVDMAPGTTLRIPSPDFILSELDSDKMVGRNDRS